METKESENNDINSQLFKKIKKYPFNGRSTYLIDKFYIIGYDYPTLYKRLLNSTPSVIKEIEEESNKLQPFNLNEIPSILNEISSDYNKEGLSEDTIIEMIFPNKVNLYCMSEDIDSSTNQSTKYGDNFSKICFDDPGKKKQCPESSKVIFSSNPQSGNNSKKSINGFAYIFYKRLRETKKINKKSYTYFIPFTFCFVSEYPYFNSFYQLCKIIENLFKSEKTDIPIEFILYNIVNFTPSPINEDIYLVLDTIGLSQVTRDKLTTQIFINDLNSRRDEKSKSLIMGQLNLFKNNKNIENLEEQGFVFLNKDSMDNNIHNINSQTIDFRKSDQNLRDKKGNSEKIIKFELLSGYPLIQYNLSKVLLHTIQPKHIILIFLYTFLEKDVIFFSKDIEFLSLTIYSYINLNFPLNDEKYYFNNASVSYDNYIRGNSQFVGSTFTTIVGINDQYNVEYLKKNNKLKDHLAVDLDNGVVHIEKDKNNKEINKKNEMLNKLIDKIYFDNDNNRLHKEIQKLLEVLNKSAESKKRKKLDFLDYEKDIIEEENLFDFTKKEDGKNYIKKKNREIQEAFYKFVNSICSYFYENLSIRTKDDDSKYKRRFTKNEKNEEEKEIRMNVIFRVDNEDTDYSEEEKNFLAELCDTMKFESFVYGFVQSYNPIDLYKIPLTFTEEFLSIISRLKSSNNRKINIEFLSLIDSFYNPFQNFNRYDISFEPVYFQYFKKYKTLFDREIYDSSICNFFFDDKILIKYIMNKDRQYKSGIIKYRSYELDENLLLKYIHLIKNLTSLEFHSLFGSIYSRDATIPTIINDIETRIESYCISCGLLSSSDLCCANIILLFALSLRSLRENMDCQSFLGELFQEFTVFRKYYTIILTITYKLFSECIEKKDFIKAQTYLLCYYPCINSLRNLKLVPNENLMIIINKFNEINIDELHTIAKEQEDNKKKEKKNEENKKNKENNTNLMLYGRELLEEDLTKKNLYLYKNFSSKRFYNENEIVRMINRSSSGTEIKIEEDTITPKIRFRNNYHSIESMVYSQKLLLETLINEYNKYIVDLNEDKLGSKIILDACLNIFIYMRGSDDFSGKDDLRSILKNIFYIFMNQLFILKSIKERSIEK